ncbi:beta-2-glycoprotein 1-like isoform X2 [Melanotaenia boesemani]|uniref:beta-2-glycoprotein 1-like isoform X2 n=1 Tax=Melanotaenia boesemani TaxID=1250792 RepID=UPI001C045AA8|nr:beta-2-glycoprotein 1-like isoform X2 [Melanotaenia boesemani]
MFLIEMNQTTDVHKPERHVQPNPYASDRRRLSLPYYPAALIVAPSTPGCRGCQRGFSAKKMAPTFALLLLSQAAFVTLVTSGKVCGRPPVTDGIDVSTLKRVFEVGEEVTLTCEQGYLPSTATPPRITCTATGEWTPSNLACSPKMCPIPRPLQPFAKGRTEAPFKSVLNFSCDDGYVMIGAKESTCLHDSTWSHPSPLCKAVNCPLPKPPKDGKIVHDKPVTGTTAIYGQGWSYECSPPKAPSYERGSCMSNGSTTEPPVCREVSCFAPTNITNGVITFAVIRPHGYKEKIKYACNEHYKMVGDAEIQCQNTGNWSSKPVCMAPCTVGIKRGRIFYNARKIWIADLKPNRVLHREPVVFYCMNKTEKCGYPVASTCNNGNLPIPECFEEPSKLDYNLRPKSLPSEITMCAASPPPSPRSSPIPA